MKEMLFLGHLGLGDHLVTNALVRRYAITHQVVVLVKNHNLDTCRFMWRDVPSISVFGVLSDPMDRDARSAAMIAEKAGFDVLRLGSHCKDKFDATKWDQELYRQAGVDFNECWTGFKVMRQPGCEYVVVDDKSGVRVVPYHADAKWTSRPYIFVHDDPARGFNIPDKRLPRGTAIVRVAPLPGLPPNIFDWWGVMARANELHVMESCFAILADHTPDLRAARYVLHTYTRKSVPPTYQRKWEIRK